MEGLWHVARARVCVISTIKRSSLGPSVFDAQCIFYAKGGQLQRSSPRCYATYKSLGGGTTSSRKQVTIRNDDGRVQWQDLTVREKAARTTQQTFNLGLILLGLTMTVSDLLCYVYHSLRLNRLVFPTYSTLKCSRQTARLDILIGPLIESESILRHWTFSDQAKPFEPLESLL